MPPARRITGETPIAAVGARRNTAALVYSTTALLVLAVFVADMQVPLGIAVWAMYLAPVALTFFAPNPPFPLYVAIATTALLVAGFGLSPPGAEHGIAQLNRTLGGVAVWIVAIAGYFFIAARQRVDRLTQIQQAHTDIAQAMLGEKSVASTAADALRVLADRVGAGVAAAYLVDGPVLRRIATWAVLEPTQLPERIGPGEGLVGQVLRDARPVVLRGVSASFLRVQTATGGEPPRTVIVAPTFADGQANGVVELGLPKAAADPDYVLELLGRIGASVGTAWRSAQYRERLHELLEETQRQGEQLQQQQEELRVSNEELEEQAHALRESQARLENQQAELEQTNVQLEEQTQRLERQKQELLLAQSALKSNAEELQRSSRYKSEFLANMSHELRTPLNSSMILSRLLAENRTGNLTPDQVRYAQIVLSANNDLLNLINDILDLSKIEAGHLQLDPQPVSIAQLIEPVRQAFQPMAEHKGLALRFEVFPDAPSVIVTDPMRLQQVLKNLLSNAVKFTERGEVVLTVRHEGADRILFAIRDTGIGIPDDQQQVIFDAFRQADGSTSRKYGGTGLGLSICRELTALLGGSISVKSQPGSGSVFELALPVVAPSASPGVAAPRPTPPPVESARPAALPLPPARPAPEPQAAPHAHARGRTILVVEDDQAFGEILCQLVRELGFDCLIATSAQEGLEAARRFAPSALLLDVGLPDHSGLAVLETLKREAATRHIPIHMVSVSDHTHTALQLGAVGYVLKPTVRDDLVAAISRLEERLDQRLHRLLVIEDDPKLREGIIGLLRNDDVTIDAVGTVRDALERLRAQTYDVVVLDLALPDGSGYDVLERMAEGRQYSFPPVIVYTGRALTRDEEQRLRRYSRSIILKGARSPERLLDEVTLFLHQVEANLPPERRRMLKEARQRDAVLEGRTILLVEDDVRNVYSLTRLFEPLGARVEVARNGREALDVLDHDAGSVDLVLMDVMMPEMDGITAMREVRRRKELKQLPIIALTAKAMPEDRVRCLEAGANDYIAKPIDIDKLISLCRVWMPK